jgi:hypothetical protein
MASVLTVLIDTPDGAFRDVNLLMLGNEIADLVSTRTHRNVHLKTCTVNHDNTVDNTTGSPVPVDPKTGRSVTRDKDLFDRRTGRLAAEDVSEEHLVDRRTGKPPVYETSDGKAAPRITDGSTDTNRQTDFDEPTLTDGHLEATSEPEFDVTESSALEHDTYTDR